MVTISINDGELNRLIEELSRKGDDAKRWLTDEVTYTALEVESRAKEGCPVKTGRLRSSIKALIDSDGDSVSAVVGTNVSYAASVEFGSETLKRRAKPFLYPAYFEAIGKLKERLKNGI